MTENIEWAREQMKQAKVSQTSRWIVEQLLMKFDEEASRVRPTTEQVKETVEVFSRLQQGHVLVNEDHDFSWVPAEPGNLVVRDYVRVKADAYDGQIGMEHNGKTGVIVAIRYGDIHVKYDNMPGSNSVKHKIDALEKKVVR